MDICELELDGKVNGAISLFDQLPIPESAQQTCPTIITFQEERKDSPDMDEKKKPINDEKKDLMVKSVDEKNSSTITIIHEERKDSTHMDEKKEPINDEKKDFMVKSVDEKDSHDSGDGEFDGYHRGDDVPTLLIFLILISYMCLSGYAFAAVEGWDYGTGVYFVFITLTTIGFGDIVSDTQNTNWNAFFSILFTIAGLAVTSMCIALAQERASRFGKRLFSFIARRLRSADDDEKVVDDPEKGPKRPNQG